MAGVRSRNQRLLVHGLCTAQSNAHKCLLAHRAQFPPARGFMHWPPSSLAGTASKLACFSLARLPACACTRFNNGRFYLLVDGDKGVVSVAG